MQCCLDQHRKAFPSTSKNCKNDFNDQTRVRTPVTRRHSVDQTRKKTKLKTEQQGRRNQRPGHSLCTLRRASRGLCDDPRRCREDTAELLRDDLVCLCAQLG
jgi:hypothetical protein